MLASCIPYTHSEKQESTETAIQREWSQANSTTPCLAVPLEEQALTLTSVVLQLHVAFLVGLDPTNKSGDQRRLIKRLPKQLSCKRPSHRQTDQHITPKPNRGMSGQYVQCQCLRYRGTNKGLQVNPYITHWLHGERTRGGTRRMRQSLRLKFIASSW